MPDLYLLTSLVDRPKVLPIAHCPAATSDDFGRLYGAWEERWHYGQHTYTTCVSVYKDQVTPQGIAYTYDLCYDGGLYELWAVSNVPAAVITQAKDYLRRSFDVVRLTVHELTLVTWTPPAPFEAVALPEWLTANNES